MPNPKEIRSGIILVKFKPGTSANAKSSLHAKHGGQLLKEIPRIGWHVVKVPPGQEAAKVEEYSQEGSVEYAKTDDIVPVDATPNDPYFTGYYQWDLTSVHFPEAWDITKGAAGILVGICDSGIDLSHPDLQGKVVASQDFSGSGDVLDHYGHGTSTGGIVGAVTNNGIGMAGGGWNTRLLNAKWAPNGSGGTSWLAEAIVWAADQGAKVINISAGAPFEMADVLDAINYAWSKGFVIVAAAGNDGLPELFYPAAYLNVISVASNGYWDDQTPAHLTPTSNNGSWIKCSAPGGNVWALLNMDNQLQPGGYGITGGTSIAAPHVSALAALLFALTNDQNAVVSAILNPANQDNLGVGGIGGGIINAFRAVASIPPPNTVLASDLNAQLTVGRTVALPDGPVKLLGGYITPQAGSRLIGGVNTALDLGGYAIIVSNVSDVQVGGFKVTGLSDPGFAVIVIANTTDVSNIHLHDIYSDNKQVANLFLVYAANGHKVSGDCRRCMAANPDGNGFALSGEGTPAPIIEDWTFYRCKGLYSGVAPTRVYQGNGYWEQNFDLAEYHGAIYRRINVIKCLADTAWEDDFHMEAAPSKQYFVLLDNMASNSGQKPDGIYSCGILAALQRSQGDSVLMSGNSGANNRLGDIRVWDEVAQAYTAYSFPKELLLTANPSESFVRVQQGNCTGVIWYKANGLADVHLYSTDEQPVNQFIPALNQTVVFTDFLNLYDQPLSPSPNSFPHGSQHTATVPVKGTPASLAMQAEVWLGADQNTKVATSGQIAFTSTGANQNIACPLTMPSTPGVYQAYVDIFVNGALLREAFSRQSPLVKEAHHG